MNWEVETYGTYETGPAIDTQTEGEVVIPAEVNGYTVVGIGGWSFRNCQKITAVSMPTTLTYIGESAFRTCYGLAEVNIPEGVTTIGERAFFADLHKVTLPSTLQEIGNNCTFKFSEDDDNVVIVNNPEPIAIPNEAFEWTSMKRSVLFVPLGSREAYQAADYWKEFKGIYDIPMLSGDAYADGEVTSADMTAAVSYILGQQPAGFVPANADMNGDHKVTIADVAAIINIILSNP